MELDANTDASGSIFFFGGVVGIPRFHLVILAWRSDEPFLSYSLTLASSSSFSLVEFCFFARLALSFDSFHGLKLDFGSENYK